MYNQHAAAASGLADVPINADHMTSADAAKGQPVTTMMRDHGRDEQSPRGNRQIAAIVVLLSIWLLGNLHVLRSTPWIEDSIVRMKGIRLRYCAQVLGSVREGWSTPMLKVAATIAGASVSERTSSAIARESTPQPGGTVLSGTCKLIYLSKPTEGGADSERHVIGEAETFDFTISRSGVVEHIEQHRSSS